MEVGEKEREREGGGVGERVNMDSLLRHIYQTSQQVPSKLLPNCL